MNEEQARAELFRLSKRANQRMLRLEREFGEEVADVYSVKKLLPQASSESSSQPTKVRFKKPTSTMTYQQTLKELKRVNTFLNAQTSTVKGAKKVIDTHMRATAIAMIPQEKMDEILTRVILENPELTNKQLTKLYQSEKKKLINDIMQKTDFKKLYRELNAEKERIMQEYGDLSYYDSEEILEQFYSKHIKKMGRVRV